MLRLVKKTATIFWSFCQRGVQLNEKIQKSSYHLSLLFCGMQHFNGREDDGALTIRLPTSTQGRFKGKDPSVPSPSEGRMFVETGRVPA